MFTTVTPKIFRSNSTAVSDHPCGSKTKTHNYFYKSKRFPPFVKEWRNSIYAFNENTVIPLPSSDKNLFKLIKSYFNLYSLSFSKKVKSKRSRIRSNKLTTNRLITSKPDLKHTGDKISITVYTYDRRKIYYTRKISKTPTLDLIVRKKLFTFFMKNLMDKNLELRLRISKRIKTLLNVATLNNETHLKNFAKGYLSSYVKKYMRREIASICYRQSIVLEQSKNEKQYLLPLVNLLERMYNKKIIFNIVSLKYFYNSCHVFSDALITKLRNRRNKPTNILRASLNTFNLPPLDRLNVYNEMYNKKKFMQNCSVKHLTANNSYSTLDVEHNDDLLDKSLSFSGYSDNTSNLKVSTPNLDQTIRLLRHKFTTGVRIEIAGRLTRRNTAERSIFKLRYKGNIKDTDSSHKGLSTVLLRGHARSNLLYNQVRSKLRIGAFGLKTWVNSN